MSIVTTINSGYLARKINTALFLMLFSILSQLGFSELINENDKEFLSTDFKNSYHEKAINIVDGNDIFAPYRLEQINDLEKNHYNRQTSEKLNHPPGYPFFIALGYWFADILDFERLAFLKLFEKVTFGLNAIVIFLVFKQFFSYYESVFGAILWIVNPLNLWLTIQPNSEIPFLLFFFLSFYFFFRMRTENNNLYLILFSVCIAVSIHLRSAALFLPLICLLIALFSSKINKQKTYNLKQKMGIFIIPYLLIAPWITFISIEHKSFIPMATSGSGMIYNGLTYLSKERDTEFIKAPTEVKDLITRIGKGLYPQSSINDGRIDIQTIVKIFFDEPYTALKLTFLKVVKSTHATFSKRDEQKIFIFNLVFFSLVAYGCFLTNKNTYLNLCILFTVYSFALCVLTFPLVRYMVPAFGLFSVYVSISLRRIFFIATKLAFKS